jgi:DNA repair photolyase
VFGLDVTHQKDPSQRQVCGCVISRDIGIYDSCLFGCAYCYATSNFERARTNHAQHHPDSPSLIGWHEASVESAQLPLLQ